MLSLLRYDSLEEAGREMVLMEAESKVSEYKSEVKKFEKKYNSPLEEFERQIRQQKQAESFEIEDDLMAWRFAQESLDYWKSKLINFEHAIQTEEKTQRPDRHNIADAE